MLPALTSSLRTSETSELPVRKRMAHTAALGESPSARHFAVLSPQSDGRRRLAHDTPSIKNPAARPKRVVIICLR